MKLLFESLCIFILMFSSVQAQTESSSKEIKADKATTTDNAIPQTIQVLSIVIGVVISVLNFANAQRREAKTRKFEAAKSFLELRQKLYLEAVQTAAVLSNPDDHTCEEIAIARKRFRQLYVAELSLVETQDVEKSMIELAKAIDPELEPFNPKREAAYNLSHALRNSLIKSWNIDESIIDNPEQ